MDNQHSKKTFPCKCVSSNFLSDDTASIEFSWPGPAPAGGQFFLIRPLRTAVFLARPISAALWTAGKDGGGIVRFIVVVRGRGSRELADLRPGEEAELTGPLGNSWAGIAGLSDGLSGISGEAEKKPIALVAGGVGIAPILAFIPELASLSAIHQNHAVFDLYAGFKSSAFGLENIKPRSLILATEDGSQGRKGRIPDFFEAEGYGAVFACGPEPMLKAIGGKCEASKIPCFVSMEKHMACGVGACRGCIVKTSGGNRCCCSDGPIFSFRELCFDE